MESRMQKTNDKKKHTKKKTENLTKAFIVWLQSFLFYQQPPISYCSDNTGIPMTLCQDWSASALKTLYTQ